MTPPHYSSVRNRRACTFINFEKKISPCTALFWSARLLILRKNSPCTFIPSYVNGLILVCTFINFEKKNPPCTALFWSACLMFSKNFPTCTFISSYTSIRYTRASDILELLNRTSYIFQNFQPIPVQSCNWLNDQWKVEISLSPAFRQHPHVQRSCVFTSFFIL